MDGCKYGCTSKRKFGNELFRSPVAYGSQLGKYTGTVNKQTALERQGYAMTTRFNNAINDKEGLIKFIQRRELLRGESGYYTAQKQNLEQQIEMLKKQRDEAQAMNQRVTDMIVNNAGRMIPASVLRFEFGIPNNTPVEPEGIVGEQPQPTAMPETPAPEDSETPTPEGSEATSPEGSETGSEEDEETLNKRGSVLMYLLDRNPNTDHEQLATQVENMTPADLDRYLGRVPEEALQRYEAQARGQSLEQIILQYSR